jgi:hypothetical protein
VKVGVRTYRRPHGLLSKLESRAVKVAGAILRGRRHGDVTLLPDRRLVFKLRGSLLHLGRNYLLEIT